MAKKKEKCVDFLIVKESDGTKEWFKNGLRHRDDGPAIEKADGTKEWWKNGEEVNICDIFPNTSDVFEILRYG